MSEQAADILLREQTPGAGGAGIERPFVVAVSSGKGGVGKSVIAANLALALALKQRRVLLWDGDFDYPNAHILFGVEPRGRANDVYSGRIKLEAALHSLSPTLDLLAGKTGGSTKDAPPAQLRETLDALGRSGYDVVVIDNAAGSQDGTIQLCVLADLSIVVATDEPTSIVDAYGLIKILKAHSREGALGLLVNNIIDRDDADDVAKKVNLATEKFLDLHIPLVGFVPYDRMVRQSIVSQAPLIEQARDSEAAQAIELTAATLDRVLAESRR